MTQETKVREYKTVGLPTFIAVIGSLCSVITLLLGHAVASTTIPDRVMNAFNERFEQRIAAEKETAKQTHDRLDERVTECKQEIGALRAKLDAYLEASRDRQGERR